MICTDLSSFFFWLDINIAIFFVHCSGSKLQHNCLKSYKISAETLKPLVLENINKLLYLQLKRVFLVDQKMTYVAQRYFQLLVNHGYEDRQYKWWSYSISCKSIQSPYTIGERYKHQWTVYYCIALCMFTTQENKLPTYSIILVMKHVSFCKDGHLIFILLDVCLMIQI